MISKAQANSRMTVLTFFTIIKMSDTINLHDVKV